MSHRFPQNFDIVPYSLSLIAHTACILDRKKLLYPLSFFGRVFSNQQLNERDRSGSPSFKSTTPRTLPLMTDGTRTSGDESEDNAGTGQEVKEQPKQTGGEGCWC